MVEIGDIILAVSACKKEGAAFIGPTFFFSEPVPVKVMTIGAEGEAMLCDLLNNTDDKKLLQANNTEKAYRHIKSCLTGTKWYRKEDLIFSMLDIMKYARIKNIC